MYGGMGLVSEGSPREEWMVEVAAEQGGRAEGGWSVKEAVRGRGGRI